MSKHELAEMRNLTASEIDLVGGGVDEIVVTGRYVRLDGSGSGSFGGFGSFDGGRFNFGSGGESGGGGVTVALDPVDSDGDGTPDENDEAPYDASNNTIVVNAPFSRAALDAAHAALRQDIYLGDIAGHLADTPIYIINRTAELFGADPNLVQRLNEIGYDNQFVNYARAYDANRSTAELFGIGGREP